MELYEKLLNCITANSFFLLSSATLLFLIYSTYNSINKWRNPRFPPGSMGFPLLGESMDFFALSSSFDIHPFIKKRMQRYGLVFKTSLVGRPLVASADPQFNHLMFQQEGKLVESWYPESFTKIFGQENARQLHGPKFKTWKKKPADASAIGPQNQASSLGMIFGVMAKKISYDPSTASEDLKKNFSAFINGLISFPISIPGTAHHKCLKGRKNVMNMLRKQLSERKNAPRETCRDYLDFVVEALGNDDSMLTETMALDLIFALLYASSETPSPALCLAVKFLADHPKVLEELTEEHDAIIRNRKDPSSGITWEEYKSMRFTFQIINETLRLANVAPVIFRKALMDISINGYTIPAGMGVMICPPASHLNPNIYKDPLEFNPRRWKDGAELSLGNKNFMPFGGGARLCVGAEFTKLQMAIFLHCLVTKWRWDEIKGGNVVRTPGLSFPDGYHIKISSRE